MPLFNKKQEKQLRTIIKEYYGDNSQYFVYSYANQIFNIPEVRNAISTYARIFSIMPIWHKKVAKNEETFYYADRLSYLLNVKPNPLQNHEQFIETMITQLMVNSNVFIEPVFDNNDGSLVSLYILPFKNPRFMIENNVAYVIFDDEPKGYNIKHNLSQYIYLSRFSQLAGGTKNNLGLYETVITALETQIVNVSKPNKVRALLQSVIGGQGQLKEKDKKGTMETVKASFDENVNGVAYLDKNWNITPINWQENDVNRALMSFIINIVYNYFSINEKIINFSASEIEIQQFLQMSGLKPLANQWSHELTDKLFTQRELEVGHRIEADVYAVDISTLQTKTSFFSACIRSGILCIDECREYIGQPPLPNGLGKMFRTTGDTMNIELADEIQLNKAKSANTNENINDEEIKEPKKEVTIDVTG